MSSKASVELGPVRYPVLLGRNVVPAVGIGLERHGELPLRSRARPLVILSHTAQSGDPCNKVPNRATRKGCFDFDCGHLVENVFAELREFRAVATRYDKVATRYDKTETSFHANICLAAVVFASK